MTKHCDHPPGKRYFHFDREKMMCECGEVLEEYVSIRDVEKIIVLHKETYDDRGVDDILGDVLREIKVKFESESENNN